MSNTKISKGQDSLPTGDQPDRSGPPPTRHGIPFDEAVSGLIKEMRRSRERQALAFAVELAESSYEAHVWKRLLIFVAEDIGLAQPERAVEVKALYDIAQVLKQKKDDKARPWRLMMVEAVLLCCRSRKSRICDNALMAYTNGEPVVPRIEDYHLDLHTTRGRKKKRGLKQFFEEGTLLLNPATGQLEHDPELGLKDGYRADAMRAMGVGK